MGRRIYHIRKMASGTTACFDKSVKNEHCCARRCTSENGQWSVPPLLALSNLLKKRTVRGAAYSNKNVRHVRSFMPGAFGGCPAGDNLFRLRLNVQMVLRTWMFCRRLLTLNIRTRTIVVQLEYCESSIKKGLDRFVPSALVRDLYTCGTTVI